MIHATVIGNVGKDAELRDAGQTRVCSFSVASNEKRKGEDVTTWVRASVWGARGEKLAPHLLKGTRVAVAGSLATREHEGKTYLELRVDQLEFLSRKSDGASANHSRQQKPAQRDDDDYARGGDDDIPF